MNENCKYCKTSKTCLENADYGSIYCQLHKRIPKVISKTYEELQEENQKYKEVIDKAYIKVINLLDYYNHYKALPKNIIDELMDIKNDVDILKEVE